MDLNNYARPLNDPAEILDWLRQPSNQGDSKNAKEVTSWLMEMWEEVRSRIGVDRFDPVLGQVRPGRVGRRGAVWTQTNGDHEGDLVNLTLEVDTEELSLNLVGWFDPQLDKVQRWLRTPAAKQLLRTLHHWDLLIFVRKAHVGPSGRAIFRGAGADLRERMPISETAPANISITLDGFRPRLDSETEKLGLHIRQSWKREELDAADDLDAQISAGVELWLDPIQEIRIA